MMRNDGALEIPSPSARDGQFLFALFRCSRNRLVLLRVGEGGRLLL